MGRPAINKIATEYDVVVVGAGATGCATARELSLRGFSVLLLDRGDIGAGTSSRSSRLLYCGLGYMKPDYPLWKIPFHPLDMIGRIYRAWLTMQCRTELVREMPEHLTRRTFYFPYAGHGGRKYPDAVIDFGYRLLSTFGSKDVPLGYKRHNAQEARKLSGLVRGLSSDLKSVGSFYEYQYSWPERICVDTALEAGRLGVTVRNYTEVTSLEYVDSLWQVTVKEKAPECHGEEVIRARMVVNAAGPWIDNVLKCSAPKDLRRQVLGVKGVNVMVKLPEEFRGQGLESFSSRGEPFYIFPWGDMHFIGPTEDRVDSEPEGQRVLESEVSYLLNEANNLFPALNLNKEDVLHAWCGVRPGSTRDGKTLSGVIQLNESLDMPNFVSVTGVMIMLHRHAARITAKLVEKKLGKKGSVTINKKRLIKKPDLSSLSKDGIEDIVKNEYVVTLGDLVRRRLPYGWSKDLGIGRLEDISQIAAKTLAWSEQRRQLEVKGYLEENSKYFLTFK
ncbi:MAG: FAD-dependent oxidoreductase [Halomonas meridiana]|uniref:FAD-dependent oxidoreductase n=1 Tax=Halomonadaceae TaxID=28256 RepID=UPI0004812730|nr:MULTISPECIES: FAD-dependent oxidoreductase [Halomonas]MAO49533.1 FAD-dependent oxidoreductase [Pusillimonas sp.]MCE7520725.1 FAD-dependent oxidoreductase [Halomonas titanicae]MDK2751950.1 FAD-dependent oxidoreductase [Halomonas meridiana]|tara:strand:- start:3706 stop:5217 length:1512 start_codon:yes stop_codon:yes gene_type:complete